MQQKINFNAGPAQLPPEVIHEATQAIRKYKKTGLSVLELPHRGTEFLEIIEESKVLVRQLAGIGSEYEVVWLQGGGRMQFCMVPMNFIPPAGTAGYIDSGHWSYEAAEYARYYGNVEILGSSREGNYNHLPSLTEPSVPLSYAHITTNNTIYGTQWHQLPAVNAPLIADMSSDIFSARIDYTKFAMFYAAAQKNLGAAGVALAVIHKDFLAQHTPKLPPMLSFNAHVKENSILNTANVFGVYVSLLTLRWIAEKGIDTIEANNKRKASLLYGALDESPHFKVHVADTAHRSLMNVCFSTAVPDAHQLFLNTCEAHNIIGVNGHRSAGGFRASLYNAITFGEVEELVKLIRSFDPSSAAAKPLRP